MGNIIFENFIDFNGLLDKYNLRISSFVNMKIGFDDVVYLLFSDNIPKRINGMFVNTSANANYSMIEILADWESGEFLYSEYYPLGKHKMNFHFIQPLGDKILLLGSRCRMTRKGPENNAVIVDRMGNVYERFCLGDGIQDCITLSEQKIVTSYFDEGIFGNYGWDEPLGICGVCLWSEKGEPVWKSDKQIMDCYAINVDSSENLWYYYYDSFEIAKTDFVSERVYDPHVRGANSFLLTKDGMNIIFDSGYNKHGKFIYAPLTYQKIGSHKPLTMIYDNHQIKPKIYSFRGSESAIIDTENRLFVKDIISVQ